MAGMRTLLVRRMAKSHGSFQGKQATRELRQVTPR